MSDTTIVTMDSGHEPGPLTLERTKLLVHEFCKMYPVAYAIKFKIRATQEELYGPNATRAKIGTVFGSYVPATEADRGISPVYRGRCDLAYSVLGGDEDLRKTLRHEIIGHFGLNTLTVNDKRGVLESLSLSKNQGGIAPYWEQSKRNYGDIPDVLIAEEVFSSVAENRNELKLTSAPPQALRRIRDHGAQLLNAQDIEDIVAHIATGLHERTRDQVIFPVDRRSQFSRTAPEKPDKKPFHEVVASELIRQIEAGTAPWQKPWSADGSIGGMPLNPTTGKRYKGINAIHLLAQGHSDPRWLTYKQAASLDAQVRKGERGTSIQYWKFEDTRIKTDESGKPVIGADGTPVQERYKLENPRVFYATVFNAEQIEGLAPLVMPQLNWDPVERAEQILANSGARIEHAASDRAYYSPTRDEIHLPLAAQFPNAQNYYATALHELGHWTGHETRLNRDLSHPFRSEGYAREELRAEIASMMLSAELGLPHDPSQHAAYVASWVNVLKKDPLEIFRAAADAEKIQALAMSFAPELPLPSPAPAPVIPDDITPAVALKAADIIPSVSAPALAFVAPKVIPMPLQPLSPDDVSNALSYISPNLPRDDWARIAMALKSEFPNDTGLDLFDQWSASGEGYDRNAVISTWRSIRAEGPVKIGTLLKQAQENGFNPRQGTAWEGAPVARMDAATQAANAAVAAQEQQMRQSQQQSAAAQAQQIWQNAQPRSDTAYLLRKSVQAHGTRSTANGTLLVPLVDDQGLMWNVQRILPVKLDNGTDKLFLKGGRKSGLFHVIGNVGNNSPQPILFAEGYATAASLHEATGWPAVVCLDAGNLIKVTNQFRSRHPDALLIVAGDDDTHTMATKGVNPGRQKAGLAAMQTQSALAFPQGLTPEHSDFNDLVAQLGTQAGHAQIRASLHDGLQAFLQDAAVARVSDEKSALLWATKAKIASEAMHELQSQGLTAQDLQAPANVNVNQLTSDEVAVVSSEGAPARLLLEDAPEFPAATAADLNESLDAPTTSVTEPAGDTTIATDVPLSDSSAKVQPHAPIAPDVSPAPAVDATTDIPVTRADPNNDLNLEALQVKRERDAKQVRQEMGKTPGPATQTSSSGFERNPSQGMNSISTAAPVQTPTPDTSHPQTLRDTLERLAKEYLYDGAGKYYLRQGPKQELAFEDLGDKFRTPHHAPEVLSSIALLSQAKGWKELHLTGTPEFRREMWLQASLLDLKVVGYQPEPIDQVRLNERKQLLSKDRAQKPESGRPANKLSDALVPDVQTGTSSPLNADPNTLKPQVSSAPVPALLSSAAAKQLDSQLREVLVSHGAQDLQAVDLTLGKLYAQVQSPRVYLGQLLDFGPAPYKFDPKEQNSYFVKLQTKSGPQTVWGVDLERAMASIQAGGRASIGQDILLAFQGVKKVQALVPQKDASGQPAPANWEQVDRNTWFAQPVLQAYAQSQKELALKPKESVGITEATPTKPGKPAAPGNDQGVSDFKSDQAATSTTPSQAMKTQMSPAQRLRSALAQLDSDSLQTEITMASMQSLLDSPKFQVGKLLEHGQAPLRFTEGQPLSYYLKLSSEQGHVMLWSADFPRAMNNHPVHLGQTIVAAYRGIEVIQDGHQRATPRNDWLVAPLQSLHEDAQQGVVQRMSNAQVMPPTQAPSADASADQQSLYILREAMRQAGIPQEFAQATLKDAEQLLGTAQAPLPNLHRLPNPQGYPVGATGPSAETRMSVTHAIPTPSISKKVGPSL